MAKLLSLALAFTALLAFATAHTTIVTTTIDDENPISSRQQCTRQLQGQQLNVCQQYLQQSIQSPFEENYQQVQGQRLHQQCCNQLQNIDEQCQCEAVKQVFRDVQHMQGQQGGRFGAQQVGQLRQKAQQLPNQCNLQTRRQCQLGNFRTFITTLDEEDNSRRQSSRGSQQCSEVQGRQFNQCQRYIQQQQQSGLLLMKTDIQGQQQTQELRSCCNELENVQRECQCEAMQEVYEQAMRQQQQQGRRQSGQRGAGPQMVQRAIQNLQNECDLQVQQCRIPSAMF
ncbi:2S seed storage protein-like [Rutidosis leptorrhynchoides]|uniref:2S seed storage protein-like n=1 Tax=Rutidosis leptorrhynchoides TaxID=125765 RepID=UPI003A992D76